MAPEVLQNAIFRTNEEEGNQDAANLSLTRQSPLEIFEKHSAWGAGARQIVHGGLLRLLNKMDMTLQSSARRLHI